MAVKSRRFKAVLSTSVMAAALLGGGLATAPAAAAAEPRPGFQIFYGADCATAYRTYTGPTRTGEIRKEAWINDTFNASSASSPGYGERIYDNAASARIQPRTRVAIVDSADRVWWASNSSYSTSRCVNLAWGFGNVNIRNDNDEFRVTAYNTQV
ncbi:hypothetical protein ACIREO_32215 [Streptomyces sp. NPDC102441]|uniref:hypothetical protein n=1 Tax=Streptomyces sp. NPDC102441 TaxID=3366176 RepID=UPI0037FD2544